MFLIMTVSDICNGIIIMHREDLASHTPPGAYPGVFKESSKKQY